MPLDDAGLLVDIRNLPNNTDANFPLVQRDTETNCCREPLLQIHCACLIQSKGSPPSLSSNRLQIQTARVNLCLFNLASCFFSCVCVKISCGMFADLKVIKCAAYQAYKNNLSCRIYHTSFTRRWAPMAASCGVKLLEPSSSKWSCRECLSSDWASMTKCCLKSQAVSNSQSFSENVVTAVRPTCLKTSMTLRSCRQPLIQICFLRGKMLRRSAGNILNKMCSIGHFSTNVNL